MSNRHEQEVQRLAELLALLVRTSDRSHRSLEKELGLGSAGLSKILLGTVRLQVTHILEICDALGVEPGHFFRLAYPKVGDPGPLIRQVRAVLGLAPAAEESQELEEQVRRVLLKLLGAQS